MGARLKFSRRSRVPKKGSRDERGFAARDGSAVKSHSTVLLQRLRRQISLNYYTIPPATQAKLNTLDNTDTETISAFVFIDSLVVSASQDAGGYALSRQNNFELPYLLIELFYTGMPVVRTDGRAGVRSRDYQNFSDG